MIKVSKIDKEISTILVPVSTFSVVDIVLLFTFFCLEIPVDLLSSEVFFNLHASQEI